MLLCIYIIVDGMACMAKEPRDLISPSPTVNCKAPFYLPGI